MLRAEAEMPSSNTDSSLFLVSPLPLPGARFGRSGGVSGFAADRNIEAAKRSGILTTAAANTSMQHADLSNNSSSS
jgi:hypothetical protein